MAIYPHAVVKIVRFHRRKIKPNRVNLHTAVSNSTTLFPFFNKPKQVCSHFYVREDGTVEQYVDTQFQAAADLQGNGDTISIETWDGYKRLWFKSEDIPPWTSAQVVAMANLLAWVHRVHDIPLVFVTDSLPGRRGVGYHRQGIDPWRVNGGLRYSNAYGKVCPGDERIKQVEGIVQLAAIAAGGVSGGTSVPPPMPPRVRGYSGAYVKEVQSLLNAVAGSRLLVDGVLGPITVGAVRAYQRSRGLVVDGDPGPITMGRLRADGQASRPVTPPPVAPTQPHPDVFPLLVDGRWGAVTTTGLQIRLSIPANGVLNRLTVVRMQSLMGLVEDGYFGPVTKQTLKNRLGVSEGKYGYFGPKSTRSLQNRLNGGSF